MRYLTLLFAICASLIPSLSVQAIVPETTITVNPLTQPLVYGGDFDVLALDFVMETSIGEVLDTITLTSAGTARPTIEVSKLTLWADIGDEGFDGWGYDEMLGETTLTSSWVFTDLDYVFTDSSQRFFVSLESGDFIQDKTFQVVISQPSDGDDDGIYQENDRGIYFNSGALDSIPVTASTTVFFKDTKLDQEAPKAFVNELVYGERNELIDPELPIIFTGQARDRGLGMTDSVKLVVENQELLADNTGINFSTWTAEFTPNEDVIDGALHLEPMDGDGRDWIGPDYEIFIDLRKPSIDHTILSTSLNGDILSVDITLRDELAKRLPSRSIDIIIRENGVDLPAVIAKTGDDGMTILSATVNPSSDIEVIILYRDVELVSAMIEGTTTPPTPEPPTNGIKSGDLIKASLDAVYYYSAEGTRHVFVSQTIFDSWYDGDFSGVKTITDAELAAIPLGAAVGYRPGSLLTAPSINEVYFVDRGQVLRHLSSEQVAMDLYGPTWNKQINDLQESLLFNYNFGTVIDTVGDVNLQEIKSTPITIDDELALS